jgi:outer membrane protein OmpA-like peptidoglycan-associated protein
MRGEGTAARTEDYSMNRKAVLLAGAVIPALLLLAHSGNAAPEQGMVVAQAQSEQDPQADPKRKPPAKPAPPAARPAPPTPPAARPTPPPPAATRPVPPPPAAARPTAPPPAAAAPATQPPAAIQRQVPPGTQRPTSVQQQQQQTPPAGTPRSQPPSSVQQQQQQQTPPGTPRSQPPSSVQQQQQTPPAGTPRSQPPSSVQQQQQQTPPGTPRSQPPSSVQQQPTTPGGGQRPAAGTQPAPLQQPPQQPAARPQLQPPAQQATPSVAPPPPPAAANVRRLDDFRSQRRESMQGSAVIIQEPGRTIVRDGGRLVIQRNDSDRFRTNSRNVRNVRTEQQGQGVATIIERPNGTRIVNFTDSSGRLLRRSRRDAGGREVVLIDNERRGRRGAMIGAAAVGAAAVAGLVILNMQPPAVRIPRDRYIVEADRADRALMYETLMAPPVEVLERDYSLDEIYYNAPLRERMRRIDIDTITFDSGSWEIGSDQARRLQVIADVILQAIQQNPDEMFLIEGHTDAVGEDVDNLSLSDRRAEAVAQVLSEEFNVPAENLTTQGYGEQYPKVPTTGPELRNRRVTILRITPLLNGPVAQR